MRWRAGFRLRNLLLGVRVTTERPRLDRPAAADLWPDDGDRERRGETRVAGVWPCPTNSSNLGFFRGDGEFSDAPKVSLIPSARDLFFSLSDFNSSSFSSNRRLVSESRPVTLTENIKYKFRIKSKAHLMVLLVGSRTDQQKAFHS